MALAVPPTSEAHLFEDTFIISGIDAKKYDRVSRISAQNLSNDTNFKLDVNTELYPLAVNDTIHVVLASTLNPDGGKDEVKGWREASRGEQTLADIYDYVCHGKIYRFDESHEDNIQVFISFGGLLMYLVGPYKKLTTLRIDHVYLLVKR